MKTQHACIVFWYILDILFICTAIPICLTWKVSNRYFTIECSVMFASSDIFIIGPCGNVRAKFILEEDILDDFTTLTFNTSKDNTEGEWKCRHRNEIKISQVSFTKGNTPMIDIEISAEKWKLNAVNSFKLACSSCWKPYVKGVDIFVNDILEDSIRYHDAQCYHKRKLCTPESCKCSFKGQSFTWTFVSDLSKINFTCAMRFVDVIKSTTLIHKAEIAFNGTVFIQKLNTMVTIPNSDVDSIDRNINFCKEGANTYTDLFCMKEVSFYTLIGVVISVTFSIVFVLRISIRQRKNVKALKKEKSKLETEEVQYAVFSLIKLDKLRENAGNQTKAKHMKTIFYLCLVLLVLLTGGLFSYFVKESCKGSFIFISLGVSMCLTFFFLLVEEKDCCETTLEQANIKSRYS